MYEFRLRSNRYNVYDIYKDNERIRDQNDLCICINEEDHDVVFYNAYTAHTLVNVDVILDEIVEILMMLDDTKKWHTRDSYNLYQINKALKNKLNE